MAGVNIGLLRPPSPGGPKSRAGSLGRILAQLVLAWVFLSAGLPKIQDAGAFASSIEAYRIISGDAVNWLAVLLPWLELVIGIGLLTPWIKQACGLSMAGLLILFMLLHASAWVRGLDISCGCFGKGTAAMNYHWLILRNLGLLFLTLPFLGRPKGTS